MTKEIQETLEGLKELDKANVFVEHIKVHFKYSHPEWNVKCKICNRDIDEIYKKDKCSFGSESISTAIGWGEKLKEAGKKLEEKDVGGECSDPLHCNICEFKKGSDEMRSIALPIIANLLLKIKELENGRDKRND